MKIKKYLLSLFFFLSVLLVAAAVQPLTANAKTNPTPANNLSDYDIKYSTLTALSDGGYMRVFTDYENGADIRIEYYDSSFRVRKKKTISRDLPLWGGFYKGSDSYYICTGKLNPDEKDDEEIIRVVRYDMNWNRLGAASITGNPKELWASEVRMPFAGTLEMTEYKGKLFLTTGHEAYVDPQYGQGHQGYLLMMVDIASMKGKIIDADCWHSFAQYIDNDGSGLFIYEQSEGSRCTTLKRFDMDKLISGIEGGNFDYWSMGGLEEYEAVFEYGGSRTSAWAIPCLATVDGLALSDDYALGIGRSIDQTKYDESWDLPYNIYLTVTPKNAVSQKKTTVKWLTSYTENNNLTGVYLTKINGNRFLVTWVISNDPYYDMKADDDNDPLSAYELHYLFVDGNGNKLGSEKTVHASFSECRPVINRNKAVFYASGGSSVDFYSIDVNNGRFSKTVYLTLGEKASWKIENGVLSVYGSGKIESTDEAFYAVSDKVKKVVVRKGITSVPDNAFTGFRNLETVVIGQGVKSIGNEAFAYNENLKKVYIPESVTSIGEDIVWTGYYWVSDHSHVYYADIYADIGTAAYEYARKNDISCISSIKNAEVTGVKIRYYTGKARGQKPVVRLGGTVLQKGTDYKIIYKNNREVGTATMTIKGIGSYSGSVTRTFRILPRVTELKTVTNPAKNKVKVSFSSVPEAEYYQIACSTSKNFAKSATKLIKTSKTTKYIFGLQRGSTYYVRVRTFRTVNGKRFYSGYSEVKTITVKK